MSIRCLCATVVLAASCLPAFAQTLEPSVVLTGSGCPVGFSASREGSLIARAGTSSQDRTRPEPQARVIVHFAKASVAQILDVQGSIYGATAAPHAQLLSDDLVDTTGPQSRTQSFHLTGFRPDASTLDWQLSVHQVPLVQGVRFTEIRLTDGSVWHESANSHCRARISGVLLVNSSSSSSR